MAILHPQEARAAPVRKEWHSRGDGDLFRCPKVGILATNGESMEVITCWIRKVIWENR
jgi:hypothetical protein